MRKFVVIATANRGVVEPPEPLDDAGQWQAAQSLEEETAILEDILRRRATRHYQLERDPMPADSLGTPGPIARMLDLARRAS